MTVRYAKYAGQGRPDAEEAERRRNKWSELTVQLEKARCAGRRDWDAGTKVHVINVQTGRALCGARPGLTSGGWREELDESVPVTCNRCAQALARRATR